MHRHFCLFTVLRHFISIRGNYIADTESSFVFRDKQPVKSQHTNTLLKQLIANIGLDCALYSMHSFRIGRTSDLIKFGYSIEEVQRLGRWRSNAVYKYIRQ